MSHTEFLKSRTSRVAPERSRNEIERILRRYGAHAFGYQTDMRTGRAHVEFVVPEHLGQGAPQLPVRLVVDVQDVYDVLYGPPKVPRPYTPGNVPGARIEQAERTAWRCLVLWIDSALAAAAVGLRSLAETFAADRLVANEDGRTERYADWAARQPAGGQLPGGARLLLLRSGA